MDIVKKLINYFKAAYPCLSINTFEEQRAIADVMSAAKQTNKAIMTWSSSDGLEEVHPSPSRKDDTDDLLSALKYLKNVEEETVIILRDIHTWPFDRDPFLARQLRDAISEAPEKGCCLVLITPNFTPYSAIEKLVTVMEYSLPNEADLREIIKGIAESAGKNLKATDEVVKALSGLSSAEAENALALSLIETKKFEPSVIYREKVAAVKRSGLLEIVDPDPNGLDAIGGLENLKNWIVTRKRAYSPEAEKYGLPSPKGVLLVGVPGNGKSLSAKAFGTALGIPTLKLDIGALFSSLVGESEAKTRDALALAEAISPCVTGDTIISMADGTLSPIIDLYRKFNPDSKSSVMCWNEKTGCIDTTEIQAVTKRKANVFHVKCALGFSINSTGNHPHLVMRGSFPEWVATEEIKKGDMIAVPMAGLKGDADATRFYPEGIREVNGELRKGRGGFMDTRIPKLPKKITTDLAWLIASVSDGDGYLSNKGRVGFTSTDIAMLDLFELTCKTNFGVTSTRNLIHAAGHISKKKNGEVIVSKKDFYGSYFNSKLVQEFIKSAWSAALSFPNECRKAALAGLLDSDGTFEEFRISLSICTDAKRRIMQARALLLSVGIIPASYSRSRFYICGIEAVKCARILHPYLHHKRKKDICLRLAERKALFTRGTGFNCGPLLQEARKNSELSHSQIGVSTSETYTFEHGRHVPELKLKNYADTFQSKELQKLIDYQCRWVNVESITPKGEQDVYDLVCTGENTRSFIANLMITHNCVIWADEIDKGLSGASGDGSNDSGVTRRVFGTLLSWMQEKKKPVFIVMTANQVDALPPEFLRKGRFDELFAIDLPHQTEREEISAVVLKKLGRDPKKFDLTAIAKATPDYTGAEIEAVCTEALFVAFDDGGREVETRDIVKSASDVIPLAKTMPEKIAAIRKWGEGRARPASNPEKAKEKSKTRKINA